jgi:cbb3-type cytochrome oxidase maturation protein
MACDPTHEALPALIIVLLQDIKQQMGALYILIGVSLIVAIGFLCVFFLAVKKGQFEDDYTPSIRMLFDDELKENNNKTIKNK